MPGHLLAYYIDKSVPSEAPWGDVFFHNNEIFPFFRKNLLLLSLSDDGVQHNQLQPPAIMQAAVLFLSSLDAAIGIPFHPVAVAVFGLPLVAVLALFREQVRHNGSDDAAVGDDTGVLPNFRKGLQHTALHLSTAFSLRRDVARSACLPQFL